MQFLIKPISFLFIIFLAYFLKQVGIFRKEHAMIVMNIILYVTLPAVAVTAFGDFNQDFSLMFMVLIGLGAALGSYFLMYLFTPKMEKTKRTYYVICASGYNVGCYALPMIQVFYGAFGGLVCIMFDVGNCMMIASGNYAFTSTLLKTEGEDVQVRALDLVKRFFSSVPVDVYLVLLVLSFIGITIPQGVVEFINPISSANAYLAMFMLGLMFTLPRQKSDWKCTFLVLLFRFCVGGGLAAILFFLLPFSIEVRQILVLILLCPFGSLSPGFIERCHGDGELASFTNSINTIASLIIMTILAGWVFA